MTRLFQKQTVFPTTMDKMIAFHNAPDAITYLTPPPLFVQVVSDGRKSLTEGILRFRLWFGPFPIHWVARHEPGPTPTSFMDRMMDGPLKSWEHQHLFREVPDGIELTDRITLEHKPGLKGLLTRLMFDGLALHILFFYRHLRTRFGLRRM